jgi:glycosyltransferase involved in cell wall biosynthesis
VERLAGLGVDLTLVTFEKPAHWADAGNMDRVRASLTRRGVRWVPLLYHQHPRLLAKAVDFVQGWAHALAARLRGRFDVLHARTYLGGLMGVALAPLVGARFVYHNEGFYPDELVDAGLLRPGSLAHRTGRGLERLLYARADGIIALSQAARRVLERLPEVRRHRTPVIVVPSCVNLDHFPRRLGTTPAPNGTLRFVYVGGVGGRYQLDRIGRFVAAAAWELGRAHLRVVTAADPALVTAALGNSGLNGDDWSVVRLPHEEVPGELARQDVGLHFLPRGLSEHAGSPTKVGEYWASGLPVAVTPNMGDTEAVIAAEKVGVLVREHAEPAYRQAARQLAALLQDPGLGDRCRRAAEDHYDLGPACERQARLYSALAKSW